MAWFLDIWLWKLPTRSILLILKWISSSALSFHLHSLSKLCFPVCVLLPDAHLSPFPSHYTKESLEEKLPLGRVETRRRRFSCLYCFTVVVCLFGIVCLDSTEKVWLKWECSDLAQSRHGLSRCQNAYIVSGITYGCTYVLSIKSLQTLNLTD